MLNKMKVKVFEVGAVCYNSKLEQSSEEELKPSPPKKLRCYKKKSQHSNRGFKRKFPEGQQEDGGLKELVKAACMASLEITPPCTEEEEMSLLTAYDTYLDNFELAKKGLPAHMRQKPWELFCKALNDFVDELHGKPATTSCSHTILSILKADLLVNDLRIAKEFENRFSKDECLMHLERFTGESWNSEKLNMAKKLIMEEHRNKMVAYHSYDDPYLKSEEGPKSMITCFPAL